MLTQLSMFYQLLIIGFWGIFSLIGHYYDKMMINLRNPAYFYILTGTYDYEVYIEILRENSDCILKRLKEIFILDDKCDFEVLKKDIDMIIAVRRCEIKTKSIDSYFCHIGCDMMEDLKNITDRMCTYINGVMRSNNLSIRIRSESSDNQTWIFKFYETDIIKASKERMNINLFFDNDRNECESFALIEYNSNFHDWLCYYYPTYRELTNIIETNIVDGIQRKYSKIKIDTKSDANKLKNHISRWFFVRWYESDCIDLANAYCYDM